MRTFKLVLFLFALPIISQGQLNFQQTYYSNDHNLGTSVIGAGDRVVSRPVAAGGYIMVGNATDVSGNDNILITRVGSTGTVIWSKEYGGSSIETAFDIKEISTGGFIICGLTSSFGAGNLDALLIRTDVNGDEVWSKAYGGINREDARSVIPLNDGFVFVGETDSPFSSGCLNCSRVFLAKVDLSGNLVWSNAIGSTGQNDLAFGESVKLDKNGGFILTGASDGFTPDLGAYLVQTMTTGQVNWNKVFTGGSEQIGYEVEQIVGGYVVVGSRITAGNESDVYFLQTKNNGSFVWSHIYPSAGSIFDIGYEVEPTLDKGYIIGGQKQATPTGQNNGLAIKTDDAGNQQWSKSYGFSGASENFYSVNRTQDGNFIFGGRTTSGSFTFPGEYYLVKTNVVGSSGCSEFGGVNDLNVSSAEVTPAIIEEYNPATQEDMMSLQVTDPTVLQNELCTLDCDGSTLGVTIAGNNLICQGDQTTLTATATGGTTPYTYIWSTGTTGNTLVNVTAAGVYTVSVSDADGCVATASFSVTVVLPPFVQISTIPENTTTFCENEKYALQATFIPGATYQWYDGDPNSGGTPIPGETGTGYVPPVSGTYCVEVTSGPCVVVECITVVVNPAPNVGIINTGGATVCETAAPFTIFGTPVFAINCLGQFTATPVPGAITNLGPCWFNAVSFDPSVAGPGVHTIQFLWTNIFGCSDSTTITITVDQAPTFSNLGEFAICDPCVDLTPFITPPPPVGTFSGCGVDPITNEFCPAVCGLGQSTLTYAILGSCPAATALVTVVDEVWPKHIQGNTIEQGNGIAVDGVGNYYVCGYFSETVDFGTGTINVVGAAENFFVVKYSCTGVEWAQTSGTLGLPFIRNRATDIKVNGNGVFVTGVKTSTTFGTEGFLLSLDPATGNLNWDQTMGGNGDDIANALDLVGTANIAVTGSFSVDMTAGTLPTIISTTPSETDVFNALFDQTTGAGIWSVGYGSTADDQGLGVTVDGSGNAITTGLYGDTPAGPACVTTPYNGGNDAFVTKLNPAGVCTNGILLNGPANEQGNDVDVDINDNIFVTGDFIGNVDFGGTPVTSTPGSGNDIFVVRLDPGLTAADWVTTAGGFLSSSGSSKGIDVVDNFGVNEVYITGDFAGALNPGGLFAGLPFGGPRQVFAQQYIDNTTFATLGWSEQSSLTSFFPGGTRTSNDIDVNAGLSYITGAFNLPIAFNTTLAPINNFDGYAARINSSGTFFKMAADDSGKIVELKEDLIPVEPEAEQSESLEIQVYPNPNKGVFNVVYSGKETLKITITDVAAKVVYTGLIDSRQLHTVNISNHSSGIYNIQFIENDAVHYKRMVKH